MPTLLPHAFIISLPDDEHRRTALIDQVAATGMEYSVIEGVDGRKFDVQTLPYYDLKKRHKYFGRDLLGGEIGCLLSHKKALETLVSSDQRFGVIFEDDAVLQDKFPICITKLATLEPAPDLVRFIAKDKVYQTKHKFLRDLCDDIVLARTRGTPGGAYAYFISRQGAEKLLHHLDNFYMPVDTIIGYSWMTGIDNLITIPSPVSHASLEDSNIGDDRFDKTIVLSGVKKHVYPFTRAFHKFRETIMKRVHFWRLANTNVYRSD